MFRAAPLIMSQETQSALTILIFVTWFAALLAVVSGWRKEYEGHLVAIAQETERTFDSHERVFYTSVAGPVRASVAMGAFSFVLAYPIELGLGNNLGVLMLVIGTSFVVIAVQAHRIQNAKNVANRVSFFPSYFDVELAGRTTKVDYGQIEEVSLTVLPWPYSAGFFRKQVVVRVAKDETPFVIPSNVRSPKLGIDLYTWLRQRIGAISTT